MCQGFEAKIFSIWNGWEDSLWISDFLHRRSDVNWEVLKKRWVSSLPVLQQRDIELFWSLFLAFGLQSCIMKCIPPSRALSQRCKNTLFFFLSCFTHIKGDPCAITNQHPQRKQSKLNKKDIFLYMYCFLNNGPGCGQNEKWCAADTDRWEKPKVNDSLIVNYQYVKQKITFISTWFHKCLVYSLKSVL